MCNIVIQIGPYYIIISCFPPADSTPEYCPPINISLELENKLPALLGETCWRVSADINVNIWRSELQNTTMELLGEDFIPEEDKL